MQLLIQNARLRGLRRQQLIFKLKMAVLSAFAPKIEGVQGEIIERAEN